jgi:hypothetical protein
MWCQFVSMRVMFLKIYYSIIIFGCSTRMPLSVRKAFKIKDSETSIDLYDKIQYLAKLLMTFTPIVWVLDTLNLWIDNNQLFFKILVWTIVVNIVSGARVHKINGTFKFKTLLWKNIEMCFIILLTYPILEGINKLTGDNIAGNVFQWVIQISTILYPGSKAIKNIYIWSNGRYPPKWIIERIYNFEKTGNIDSIVKGIKVNKPIDTEFIEKHNFEPLDEDVQREMVKGYLNNKEK